MFKLFSFQLIISFVSFGALGNTDLFSKFNQNTFKIKDFRAELDSYDKDLLTFCEIKTYKYNRSVAAMNVTLIPKIDLHGDKIEMLIQSYKFASNEYRRFPIRFQVNAYKAVKANILGLEKIFECGNFPSNDFYFAKNVTYHVCNYVPDAKKFPPLIPTGRYMTQSVLFYEDKRLSAVKFYGESYIPIKIPN